MARINHRPDKGALGANGGDLLAQHVIDDGILQLAGDRAELADISGQNHLIHAVSFGFLLGLCRIIGLAAAVARIIEKHGIARTCGLGQPVQFGENGGTFRQAPGDRVFGRCWQIVGQHGDVIRCGAALLQGTPQDRHIVARPEKVLDARGLIVISDAHEQGKGAGLGKRGSGEHDAGEQQGAEQFHAGGCPLICEKLIKSHQEYGARTKKTGPFQDRSFETGSPTWTRN